MKNLNNIISRLSRSGLLPQTSRSTSKSALKHAVTDTILRSNTRNQSPLQTGALAAVGGMAWKAYQVYSQQAYGRNTSLQKANLHRAYQLGVYAQRNAQQKMGLQICLRIQGHCHHLPQHHFNLAIRPLHPDKHSPIHPRHCHNNNLIR